MSLLYFLGVFQRQGTGSKVSRIGIIAFALDDKLLEVGIRDDGFATNHEMAFLLDGLRNATDGRSQMGDVGSDMSVATGYYLRELSVVVGYHKGKTIQFPGNPDRAVFCPFHQVAHQFGLGK